VWQVLKTLPYHVQQLKPLMSSCSSLAHTTATCAKGALLIHILAPFNITDHRHSLKMVIIPAGFAAEIQVRLTKAAKPFAACQFGKISYAARRCHKHKSEHNKLPCTLAVERTPLSPRSSFLHH